MALVKQLKLAARTLLGKKNPSPSSLFMEQSFALKVKFLKRARKQPRYTH